MLLAFHQLELIALGATLIAALVALEGESNWMEGAQLLMVTILLAMTFFFFHADVRTVERSSTGHLAAVPRACYNVMV